MNIHAIEGNRVKVEADKDSIYRNFKMCFMETPERLLTVNEAAERLGFNRKNTNPVRTLIKAGKIKAVNLRSLKIREKELNRFIRESEGMDYSDLLKGVVEQEV